jgi:aspartate/methionine/tyrosine aminotransferase
MSIGEAEKSLWTWPGPGTLNATHADTHRFPPPDWALEEFSKAASGAGNAYTAFRGDQSVLGILAPSLQSFLGIDVDPRKNIVLSAGTQGGLFATLSALVEPGDTVVLADPDYLSSERLLRYLGATVEHVLIRWQDGVPALDTDELTNAFERGAHLLLFSHPNNPTGAVYTPECIREIAAIIKRFDAFVVVDQLYSRLVYDGLPFAHLIAEEGMQERCVTTLGPSKAESMSGYRLGVVVGPTEIINAIEDVQAITSIRAPAYAQWTLCRWLSDDADFMASRIEDYQLLRDRTVGKLKQSNLVRLEVPRGSSYVFVDVSAIHRPIYEVAEVLLKEARVVVNPGYQFGPSGVNSFRLCFAQEETRWDQTLDAVVASLEGLANRNGR